NGDRSARVLWTDESDASHFAATGGFEVNLKEREYMYDPRRVSELKGHQYKDLRKRTRRFQRANDHVWRELRPEDTNGCIELLRKWKKTQGKKRTHLLDMGYTRAAIELYPEFERKDLSGCVVLVEGEVKAFCMGGEMSDTVANFFAAKSDPEIYGLSEFSRWCFCRGMAGFELINDASDLGLPGLEQFKRKFRPVAMLDVFTVSQGPG
ncbi:MAG: phosphatidylglycerol lysyltransferase domain-containing protein, partial [Planctomycetota bacterium]